MPIRSTFERKPAAPLRFSHGPEQTETLRWTRRRVTDRAVWDMGGRCSSLLQTRHAFCTCSRHALSASDPRTDVNRASSASRTASPRVGYSTETANHFSDWVAFVSVTRTVG
jgi:hypothetical protein